MIGEESEVFLPEDLLQEQWLKAQRQRIELRHLLHRLRLSLLAVLLLLGLCVAAGYPLLFGRSDGFLLSPPFAAAGLVMLGFLAAVLLHLGLRLMQEYWAAELFHRKLLHLLDLTEQALSPERSHA